MCIRRWCGYITPAFVGWYVNPDKYEDFWIENCGFFGFLNNVNSSFVSWIEYCEIFDHELMDNFHITNYNMHVDIYFNWYNVIRWHKFSDVQITCGTVVIKYYNAQIFQYTCNKLTLQFFSNIKTYIMNINFSTSTILIRKISCERILRNKENISLMSISIIGFGGCVVSVSLRWFCLLIN